MPLNMGIVVLAAGKGTRLKLDVPKVLLPLCGRAMLDYVLDQTELFARQVNAHIHYGIVVGHGRERVESHASRYFEQKNIPVFFPHQEQQLGTGHAVSVYFAQVARPDNTDLTMVLCGDTPLILAEELAQLYHAMEKTKPDVVVASFRTPAPQGYGRIVKNKGKVRIVEEKNASAKELRIDEVNASVYIFKTKFLQAALKRLKKNPLTGEIYLTDVVAMAKKSVTICFPHWQNFLGINHLGQWEEASQILRSRKIHSLQQSGVLFFNSSSVTLDWNTEIEPGTRIHAGVVLEGKCHIGKDVDLETGCILKNSLVKARATIKAYSYLDQAIVHEEASVGPFAHLRPGSEIGPKAKVGNFVETKKAKLHRGVKVSHLSYVGDAEIGEETNIGCGFITCNYDGVNKHFTKIGAGSFIGSDCQTIAPVEIGNDAFVAAGSTITHDVPDGALALARTKQVNKEGRAKMFLPQKKQK